jgi:hypothetical protein
VGSKLFLGPDTHKHTQKKKKQYNHLTRRKMLGAKQVQALASRVHGLAQANRVLNYIPVRFGGGRPGRRPQFNWKEKRILGIDQGAAKLKPLRNWPFGWQEVIFYVNEYEIFYQS